MNMKDKRDKLLNELHKIVKEYWHNVHERSGAGTHAAISESHERLEAKLKEIDFFDSLMKESEHR